MIQVKHKRKTNPTASGSKAQVLHGDNEEVSTNS